jgi:hypothetical protein
MKTYLLVRVSEKTVDLVVNRAIELGYRKNIELRNCQLEYGNVCLNTNDFCIQYVSGCTYPTIAGLIKANAEWINLEDLFYTDKYKARHCIKVKINSEYTAEVTDVIKVGCTTITQDKFDELVAALKKWRE